MNKEFLNKKLMKSLGDYANASYKNKEKKISYDQVTRNILKSVNWSEPLNLQETVGHLYIQIRYSEKLLYYYDQIIKSVSMDGYAHTSASEYSDFWNLLSKLGIEQYFVEYKCKDLNSKNLFSFLALFKSKLNKTIFTNNFKLKSIEMIEYKKGLDHERK